MLTVVILAKNAVERIAKCLESVKFADEVILIDDESTDKTIEIAKKFNAIIYKRKLDDNFAQQRNFGIKKAKNEWVLFVDDDEIVSEKLKGEILEILRKAHDDDTFHAFCIKRRDFFWDRELRFGEVRKARIRGIIRLVRKGRGKWKGAVHEEYVVKGQVGRMSGFIDHFPHQTIAQFLQSINLYSDIRAKELVRSEEHQSMRKAIFYPFGKFLYTYFVLLGVFDGPAGFVYSFMMSFHSFLVHSKRYLLCHKF